MATYNDNSTANVTSSVTWNSSDNMVATVSASGFITSVTVGNTTITASLSGLQAASNIIVEANVLKSLIIEPAMVSVDQGQTQALIATATYAFGSPEDVTSSVTWSSDDDTVSTVSNDGVITGVTSGMVIITANLSGKEASSDITVSNLVHNLRLFISANDGIVGQELFVTDGTAEGTILFKDINPTGSSDPHDMTVVNGVYYFAATDGLTGIELWKSDGTATGTVLVKDIYTGENSSSPSSLTALGNTLYFTANDGTHGKELWKSDGTIAGTVMVKDIGIDNNPYYQPFPEELTVMGKILFFNVDDGVNGVMLWKSDGTEAGTVMVKSDSPELHFDSFFRNLAVVGNTLFFGNLGNHGSDLWKTDGTTVGTVSVKGIDAGEPHSPHNLTTVGNTLFFGANNYSSGVELWKSDGTSIGTMMVKDINPVPDTHDPGMSFPGELTAVGNMLYFRADDGINSTELWKSDGTTVGTVMAKDTVPDHGSVLSTGSASNYFINVDNTLFFTGNEGAELWKSDGTNEGTVIVKDNFVAGTYVEGNRIETSGLTTVGNTLYFSANDGIYGYELWKSNGTPEGTVLVKDINANPGESSNPVILKNNLFD